MMASIGLAYINELPPKRTIFRPQHFLKVSMQLHTATYFLFFSCSILFSGTTLVTMKFGIVSLVFASACVSGTAGFSANYLSSLNGPDDVAAAAPKKNYSPTSWKPTGAKRTTPAAEAYVLETTIAPAAEEATSSTIDLTNFLRIEYDAWLSHHGKIADESRFKSFKDNYVRQWQADRVTGDYHFLNQYGDLSPEEYSQMTGVTLPAAPAPVPEPVVAAPAASPKRKNGAFAAKKAAPLQASFGGAFSAVSRSARTRSSMESAKAINKQTNWEAMPDDLTGNKLNDYPVYKRK
jgi:hypothetical protein